MVDQPTQFIEEAKDDKDQTQKSKIIDIENFDVDDLDESVAEDKPHDSVIIRHSVNPNGMRDKFDLSSIGNSVRIPGGSNEKSNEKPEIILTDSQDMSRSEEPQPR